MNNILNLLPLFSSIFILVLGVTIIIKGKNKTLNSLFAFFSFIIAAWMFGTFMMFIADTQEKAFFWDRLIYIAVIFIPSTIYHFAVEFAEDIKKRVKSIVFGYIMSVVFLILNLTTKIFIDGIFKYPWGIHAKAQIAHHFFMVFFVIYLILMFAEIIKAYRCNTGIRKKKAKLELLALAVLAVGALGFLPAYGISIIPFAYLTGLLFAVITGYAITRYQLLEIRVFTVHILIVILNLLVFSYIFLSRSVSEYIVRIIFFVSVLCISLLLKRNLDKELIQKKKLEILNNKLERTNKKLIELDRAKNEFISIATHQLRTPPTVIKGYITLAKDSAGVKMNKGTLEALNRALISNERLIGLVDDILNISRIESGKMQYTLKKQDFNKEIVDVLYDEFKIKAKNKGLKLITKKEKLPRIKMDGRRVVEVVSNLLDNAIKYTKSGSIKMMTRRAGKNKIRIEVSDTGVGILKKDIGNLFKKFSRGSDTDRLGADGTGLGLYVGRKIIESHGGKIWAESKGIGKGSTFIIELPINGKKKQT